MVVEIATNITELSMVHGFQHAMFDCRRVALHIIGPIPPPKKRLFWQHLDDLGDPCSRSVEGDLHGAGQG